MGADAETEQDIWCPHLPLPVVLNCTFIYACKFHSTDMCDVQGEKLLSHCIQPVHWRFVESFSLCRVLQLHLPLRLLSMLSVCRSRVVLSVAAS